MADNHPERKKRTELDYLIFGVLLAVLAQAMYDIVRDAILGQTKLEWVDLGSGVIVFLVLLVMWRWVSASHQPRVNTENAKAHPPSS